MANVQVPRLTAMLRAFSKEGGALDVGDLHLQRKQALEARRRQQSEKVCPKMVVCGVAGRDLRLYPCMQKSFVNLHLQTFHHHVKGQRGICLSRGIWLQGSAWRQASCNRFGDCSPAQAIAVGSSPLALALLGPWAKAPKQARDDYERFVRSVSRLLGGEAPFEEVQVCSGVCHWLNVYLKPGAQQRAVALHRGRLRGISILVDMAWLTLNRLPIWVRRCSAHKDYLWCRQCTACLCPAGGGDSCVGCAEGCACAR